MTRSPAAKKYDKKKKLKKAKLKKKLKQKLIQTGSNLNDNLNEGTTNAEPSVELETTRNEKRQRSIEYIKKWKKNREDWKFNKIIQIYIVKNWLNDELLKDRYFEWFCEYCKGLPSQKKESLSSEAVKLMESQSISPVIQSRARQLVQCL